MTRPPHLQTVQLDHSTSSLRPQVLVRPIKTRHVSVSPHYSLTLQTSKNTQACLYRRTEANVKHVAPPPTQTEEQTVVAHPFTENDAPPHNPPSADSKSEGQMSVIHVIYVNII